MCNCGKNSCSQCNSLNSQAALLMQLGVVNDALNSLLSQTKWLNGHPIIAIDDPLDIACFDPSVGEGSGNWIGWGICNGNAYKSTTGTISTPDLRDRFLTGSGGSYNVGDIGGESTHQLTIQELPIHTHTITDPGHTHTVNDPGHTHTITDPGHTHIATGNPHQHSFVTDPADGLGGHTHSYQDHQKNNIYITGVTATAVPVIMTESTSTLPGSILVGDDNDHSDTRITDAAASYTHTHTGTTDTASPLVTNSIATTGNTNLNSTTGNTNNQSFTGITSASVGGDLFHENRPPYYACIFIKKIF